MDAGSASMCAVMAALKCPSRVKDLLSLFPQLPDNEPTYGAAWAAIQRCSSIGLPDTVDEWHNRLLFDLQARDPAYLAPVRVLVAMAKDRSDLTSEYLLPILREYALKQAVELVRQSTGSQLTNALAKAQRINSMAAAGVLEPVDLDDLNLVHGGEIVPIGCPLIDNPFGGLPPKGSLTMWVGPQKSGKTMGAMQINRAMVDSELATLYLNFEQQSRGNLMQRVYASMTGTEITRWTGIRTAQDVPADLRERLMAVRDRWKQYFTIYSATELNKPGALEQGVESLFHLITDLYVNRGRPVPELIIIDWWRRLWERYLAVLTLQGKASDGTRVRQLEIENFLRLKTLAEVFGTRVLVYQQMAAAKADRAFNIDKIGGNDVAENRSLGQIADAVVANTTKDPETKIVSMKLCYTRFCDDGWKESFRMDGIRQHFVPANIYDVTSIRDETDGMGEEEAEDAT